jgi:hypothetical protein
MANQFFQEMRELESTVGNLQAKLVLMKVLFTPGMVSSVRMNLAEPDIIELLAGNRSDDEYLHEVRPQLDGIRERAISLVRQAEALFLNAASLGNLPDTKREIISVELLRLLETIDVLIARFLAEDKIVSRKFGPMFKLALEINR